jgi:hypothetical protein
VATWLRFRACDTAAESDTFAQMRNRFRCAVAVVILGLLVSGITTFPLLQELNLMAKILVGESGSLVPADHTGFTHWILHVREGLEVSYAKYPFIGYGTDWLGFGHIIIALFFILPFREPVRYRGVLHVGVAACILVIPHAIICGIVREIPFYWSLIDMSFGLLCLLPLFYAISLSKRIEAGEDGRGPSD